MFRNKIEVEEIAPDLGEREKVIAANRTVNAVAPREGRFNKNPFEEESTRPRQDSENLNSKSPALRLHQLEDPDNSASPIGKGQRQMPKSLNTSSGITSTKSSSKNGQEGTLDFSRDQWVVRSSTKKSEEYGYRTSGDVAVSRFATNSRVLTRAATKSSQNYKEGLVGLENFRFFCYLNACLQALMGISELRDYYVNEEY